MALSNEKDGSLVLKQNMRVVLIVVALIVGLLYIGGQLTEDTLRVVESPGHRYQAKVTRLDEGLGDSSQVLAVSQNNFPWRSATAFECNGITRILPKWANDNSLLVGTNCNRLDIDGQEESVFSGDVRITYVIFPNLFHTPEKTKPETFDNGEIIQGLRTLGITREEAQKRGLLPTDLQIEKLQRHEAVP